jgi:uncharacterized protein with PIN domain
MLRCIFRFHGPLNDFLLPERRFSDIEYRALLPGAVKDAIEALGPPHPEVGAIKINGLERGFGFLLSDGDRIEIFPEVPAAESHLRAPLESRRFVLDVHLGTLAGYLRLLGFDALYRNDAEDAMLAEVAGREQRVLLTRDVGLLKRNEVVYGRYVRATEPRQQLREIVKHYRLSRLARPLTRCLRCNGQLVAVPKHAVESQLPPRTAAAYDDFWQCASCGQVYWQGTHFDKLKGLIEESLRET